MTMRVISVSECIELVNVVLRNAWSGEEIVVQGEVSGYRVSQGQWVSFDLKDDRALVNVFMPVWNLKVPIEDGLTVKVYGAPRVYPKYGKFSLSAERVELAGEGSLRRALALLRERLAKEGLFDPARKRPLPRFPERIALIASKESAAYGDFIRVLNERWGGLQIDVYHVLVQGERAPATIVDALERAQTDDYDVIVLTRGGGSLEELMAFNDERLVRAIHGSKIPTLVGIGHERDITLAEEAADVRASTPTDCARRLVPDRRDVSYELATLLEGMESSLMQQLEQGSRVIERALLVPEMWLTSRRQSLELVTNACSKRAELWLAQLREKLDSELRLLASLDPRQVLARGYAILKSEDGHGITSTKKLRVGASVSIQLRDGEADATVTRLGTSVLQEKLL